MMNRIGRVVSMEGSRRDICKMDADELDVELDDSAGMYIPLSRKDLMFDIRRSDEAEGDKRMIGSGRRTGALGL